MSTQLAVSGIDWAKPLLLHDEVHAIMGGKDETFRKWCREHPEFCKPTKDGRFLFHRDRFVDWVGSVD
ncbi:MAG: hypothetical protein WBD31_01085 [Rubripirellula sp.]